jgi:hypothetical protein
MTTGAAMSRSNTLTQAGPHRRPHPAHLAESIGAVDLTLDRADLAEIDEIMAAAVPVGGPTPRGMT